MGLSLVFLLAGYNLLFKGWRLVHNAQGRLVTNGVYRFAGHPQYAGLFLVIVGFLIQWPILVPVMVRFFSTSNCRRTS
jgi:protein-S-isoprenylcysteine O-methyltransferase Ste14